MKIVKIAVPLVVFSLISITTHGVTVKKTTSNNPPCPLRAVMTPEAWTIQEAFEQSKEAQKLELEQRKFEEKKALKSLKDISGYSIVNKLLAHESNIEKKDILNAQPSEVRQHLMVLIDHNINLLDPDIPEEDVKITSLNNLKEFINKNL